jgi:hypothetical protein
MTVEAAVSAALRQMQATRLPLQLLLQHNCLGCDGHDMGEAIFNSSKKLSRVSPAFLRKVVGKRDRCAAGPTLDRVAAVPE